MTSALTGVEDLSIELSKATLTALARSEMVGQTIALMQYEGNLLITDVDVIPIGGSSSAPDIEVHVRIGEGLIRRPAGAIWGRTGPAYALERFQTTISFQGFAALREQANPTGWATLQIQPRFNPLPSFSFDPAVRDQLVEQLRQQGVPTPAFELDQLCADLGRGLIVVGIKLPIEGIRLGVPPSVPEPNVITFRHVNIAGYPATATRPGALAVLGSLIEGHGSSAEHHKTRLAIDNDHEAAIALSPDGFRDIVLCPAIAAVAKTGTDKLCPACGGGGPVSLLPALPEATAKRLSALDLTSVSQAFEPGSIVINVGFAGRAAGFGVSGGATARIAFSVDGGVVTPHISVACTLDIAISTAIHVVTMGALKALEVAIEDVAESFLDVLLTAELLEATRAGLDTLPNKFGDLALVPSQVHVDSDGLRILYRVDLPAVAVPWPRVRLNAALVEQETWVTTDSMTGAVSCSPSRAYTYTDSVVETTWTFDAQPLDLGQRPYTLVWRIAGQQVPPGSRSIELSLLVDTWTLDDVLSTITIATELSADNRTLVVRNRPLQGNYWLVVSVELQTATGHTRDSRGVAVTGLRRDFEDAYEGDFLRCMIGELPELHAERERRPIPSDPGWVGARERSTMVDGVILEPTVDSLFRWSPERELVHIFTNNRGRGTIPVLAPGRLRSLVNSVSKDASSRIRSLFESALRR
jgi:hypothetical protein